MANRTRPPLWEVPVNDPTGRRAAITHYANARMRDWWQFNAQTAAHEEVMGSDAAYFDDGTSTVPSGWGFTGSSSSTVVVAQCTPPEGVPGFGIDFAASNTNGICLPGPSLRFKIGQYYNLSYWLKVISGTVKADVVHIADNDAETSLGSRTYSSAEWGSFAEVPGGWREKPFLFRIEPGIDVGKRIEVRFTGTSTGSQDNACVADVCVQEGRVEFPSISHSKREDYQAHGKSRVLRPIKQCIGDYNAMAVDTALKTVGFPRGDIHRGTFHWAFSATADQGLMWNIKLPMEWTFGAALKAIKFVWRWTTPTGLTATDIIVLEQGNKIYNGNDNDTINIPDFGTASGPGFDIDNLTTTAFEEHDTVHNMTSNSPAKAGNRKESSWGWIYICRQGTLDNFSDEWWLIPADSFIYWFLLEDHDDFFDRDQNHPVVTQGDYCDLI